MTIRYVERLREFARTRAKASLIIDAAPSSHQFDAASRFECTDQNEPVRFAFDEHVQHPMRAVTEVNVSGARRVVRDEAAGAPARECLAGAVAGLEKKTA